MDFLTDLFLAMFLIAGILFFGIVIYAIISTPIKLLIAKRKINKEIKKIVNEPIETNEE